MSDEHHHTPADATAQPSLVLRTIIIVCAAVLVLAFLLIKFTLPSDSVTSPETAAETLAKAQRLQKVGSIAVRAPTDRPLSTGQEVYDTQCFACHATGISDAPKFADKAQWAPRIEQGMDALIHSALKGKGLMPPQAGGQFSDYEIERAVVYMANEAGANFPEPTPPAEVQ